MQVMQSRADELRRVTAQRNAAEHELRTILAERKGVLEENQKLTDDLAAVRDEQHQHDIKCDAEQLRLELDAERRFRDEVVSECGELRDKLLAKSCGVGFCSTAIGTVGSSAGEENGNGNVTDSASDKPQQNQRLDKFDAAASIEAADKLRKQLERAYADTKKATAETEVAKSRRDWAISEREKIVLERDSVKYLCDELRKERDTAISELLAAIRDSEKIKKQKDEACREVEQIREQLDAIMTTSYQDQHLLGGSRRPTDPVTPRWSMVIGEKAPTQEVLQLVELDMRCGVEDQPRYVQGSNCLSYSGGDHDFGISLEGGRSDSDSTHLNAGGVFVVSVAPTSPAYGRLKPNDCIVEINQLDCTGASKRTVLEKLRSTANTSICRIVVRRPCNTSDNKQATDDDSLVVVTAATPSAPTVNRSHMYAVQLNLTAGTRNHGIHLETGVYIARIAEGSLAARDGCELLVGDRVLSVNSRTMEGVQTAKEAMSLLDDNRPDTLTIISLKQVQQQQPMPTISVGGRGKWHNKMTNSCTQTDIGWTMAATTTALTMQLPSDAHSSEHTYSDSGQGSRSFASTTNNSKSTSKISDMINKFKGKMNKPGSSSMGSGSGGDIIKDKSKQSSRSNAMVTRISDAENIGLEQDAIQVLDSVLNMENSSIKTTAMSGKSKDNLFKRSKRSLSKKDDKKDASKSMGTWPRANMLLSSSSTTSSGGSESGHHHAGTIVQHRKKERPALSFFTGPLNLGLARLSSATTPTEVENTMLSTVLPTAAASTAADVSPSNYFQPLVKPQNSNSTNIVPFISHCYSADEMSATCDTVAKSQQRQQHIFNRQSMSQSLSAAADRGVPPYMHIAAQLPPLVVNRHSIYAMTNTGNNSNSGPVSSDLDVYSSPSILAAPQQQQNALDVVGKSNTLSRTQQKSTYYHQLQHQQQLHESICRPNRHGSAHPNRMSLNIPNESSNAHHLYNTLSAQYSGKSPPPPIPMHKELRPNALLPAKRSLDHLPIGASVSLKSPDSFLTPLSLTKRTVGAVLSMDSKRLSMTSPHTINQLHHNQFQHSSSSQYQQHPPQQKNQKSIELFQCNLSAIASTDSATNSATFGGKSAIDSPAMQNIQQNNHQVSCDLFNVLGNGTTATMRTDPNRINVRTSAKFPSESDSIGMLEPNTDSVTMRLSRGHHRVAPSPATHPPPLAPFRMTMHHPPSTSGAARYQRQQFSGDKLHEFEYSSLNQQQQHVHHHGVLLDVADIYGVNAAATSTDASATETSVRQSDIDSLSSKPIPVISLVQQQQIPNVEQYYNPSIGGSSGNGMLQHSYEGGTFPRKKENQRFRIPSNPNVISKGQGSGVGIVNVTASGALSGGAIGVGNVVKNSTGSIEKHGGSERGSPMPPAFQVEVLSHGANKRNSMPDYCYGQKPSPGDLRRVTIDKSVELGITITCNTGGGIFVSTVADNSIASQVSDGGLYSFL